MEIFCIQGEANASEAKIRVWQWEVYGGLFVEIYALVDDMDELHQRLCNEMLVDSEHRRLLVSEFWRKVQAKESMLA